MPLASDIVTMMESDFDAVRTDSPCTIVWSGQSVAATDSPDAKQANIDEAGVIFDCDKSVAVKVSLFTSSIIPKSRDQLTVDGVYYVVQNVDTDGVVATLYLKKRSLS